MFATKWVIKYRSTFIRVFCEFIAKYSKNLLIYDLVVFLSSFERVSIALWIILYFLTGCYSNYIILRSYCILSRQFKWGMSNGSREPNNFFLLN